MPTGRASSAPVPTARAEHARRAAPARPPRRRSRACRARAAARPSAAATVVLPTPPLPVTTTSRLSRSDQASKDPRRANGVQWDFRRSPSATSRRSERNVIAKAKVIAFTNQKGGVAKTTTTLNLAAAFAEKGHRVLCVDLDPQGNLTMSQGIDPDSLEVSMYDVLVHQHLDPRGDPQARGGRRLRLDRPRRRRDRDVHDDRPRALAEEGARADPRRLRLHLHRHAAEPRAAHDQRPDGLRTR